MMQVLCLILQAIGFVKAVIHAVRAMEDDNLARAITSIEIAALYAMSFRFLMD